MVTRIDSPPARSREAGERHPPRSSSSSSLSQYPNFKMIQYTEKYQVEIAWLLDLACPDVAKRSLFAAFLALPWDPGQQTNAECRQKKRYLGKIDMKFLLWRMHCWSFGGLISDHFIPILLRARRFWEKEM